jgi:hypothetical protein
MIGTTIRANGSNLATQFYGLLDIQPASGNYQYRVKCVSQTGAIYYSDFVKVAITKNGKGMYVYPNPVTNNVITLKLGRMEAGKFQARLLTENGVLILAQTIQHAGGSASYTIQPGQTLVSGSYLLEVIDAKGNATRLKVMAQTK